MAELKSFPIRQLLAEVVGGKLRIPAFQRAFVWDSERIAQILPGTTPYDWKCRLGHEARQSVPHRVKSRGCIHCPPGIRSAASKIAA